MGLQAIREILQKMPDMEAKISVVREVMSTFQGGSLGQPQEEVKGGEEELHSKVIESIKDVLSEYLKRREKYLKTLQTEEEEEHLCEEKFEEVRQQI